MTTHRRRSTMRFKLVRWAAAALLLMAAVAAGCDDDTTSAPSAGSTDGVGLPADAGSTDSTGSPAGSTDFQTVFGIPPFGMAALQPGFGDYSMVDNEFQTIETVFFEMTGTDRDAVIGYYTDLLPAAGYSVGAPLALGESVAISLSMAGDPTIIGVVQVGPLSPGNPTLGVNHERTQTKTGQPTTVPEAVPSSGAVSSDSAGDGATSDG